MWYKITARNIVAYQQKIKEKFMKKLKTLSAVLLVAAIIMAVFVPAFAVPDAPDGSETTKLTITKLQMSNLPSIKNHDGSKINDLTTIAADAKGLADVKFTYWRVSNEQLEAMKTNPSSYDTVAKVVAAYTALGAGTETTATDVNGETVINALEDGNYWFVESAKPDSVVSALAVPFGLALPLRNADGTANRDIYVYPKNTTSTTSVDKDITEVGQKTDNYDVGKVFPWIINAAVPANIKAYQKFDITDTLDSRLDFVSDSIKVYYAPENSTLAQLTSDKELGAGFYEASYVDNSRLVKVSIKEFSTFPYVEGNKLFVKFDTKINETAVMGIDIPNDVNLNFDNGNGIDKDVKPSEKPKVKTGGIKFVKVDHKDNKPILPTTDAFKAKFIVSNTKSGTTTYLKKDTDANTTIWVANKNDATVFETGNDGTFEIKGLEFSSKGNNYKLVEIQAPSGYAKLTSPVDFTITENSYNKNATVINEHSGDTLPPEAELADPTAIQNRKLIIPQTGGIGTLAFTAGGLAIMGAAVVAFKKNKKKSEE